MEYLLGGFLLCPKLEYGEWRTGHTDDVCTPATATLLSTGRLDKHWRMTFLSNLLHDGLNFRRACDDDEDLSLCHWIQVSKDVQVDGVDLCVDRCIRVMLNRHVLENSLSIAAVPRTLYA